MKKFLKRLLWTIVGLVVLIAAAVGVLLLFFSTPEIPAATLAGIVCGNTLEALLGAFLLVRVAHFRPSLQRVRDVLALVLFGAVISTTVSA